MLAVGVSFTWAPNYTLIAQLAGAEEYIDCFSSEG